MQIRSRLTIQFIVMVSLILLLAFGLVYSSSFIYRKNEFYQRLENKAKTSAEIFASVSQIDSTTQRLFDNSQKDKLLYENISIYDLDNKEVYTNNDTITFKVTPALLHEVRTSGRKELRENAFEILALNFSDKNNQFVVFAGAIDQYGLKKLYNLGYTLIILFLAIVSVVAIAGWIYAGRALRPLRRVINEVQEIDIDNLETRLNSEGKKDEIGRLINTFNLMLNRIENAFKLQKLFLNGASHELKNPLTSITSQLQVVLLNERSNEEYKKIIRSILEDISHLNRTAHDLMEYARLSHENMIQLTGIRIDDILWSCHDFFIKTNPEYKVVINLEQLPSDENRLIILGNEALLKIAIINLIDNACKFSPAKSCKVKLRLQEEKLILEFADEGVGFREEERDLIFEPFYRSDKASDKQGHGLGLALVKKIILLHKSHLQIQSAINKGSVFTLVFPISNSL